MTNFTPRTTRKPKKRTAISYGRAALQRGAQIVRAILMRPLLLLMLGLVGFTLFVGTPHVAWDYQCSHSTRGGGFCRAANWCAYYGVQGRRVVFPPSGETCQLITFLPIDWAAILNELRTENHGQQK